MLAVHLKRLKSRLHAAGSLVGRQTQRDRILAQRLHRTFERDLELADVHGVAFYIQNGVVTLDGTVRHALDRDLLLSLVRQIPGVKSVVSHLEVAGPDPSNETVSFFSRNPLDDDPFPF